TAHEIQIFTAFEVIDTAAFAADDRNRQRGVRMHQIAGRVLAKVVGRHGSLMCSGGKKDSKKVTHGHGRRNKKWGRPRPYVVQIPAESARSALVRAVMECYSLRL